ncbi:hypothetical protein [Janthinobacterium sp. LB3P118]|uniref:hypothetical protein n=1 Tax=Janthinobacterium sp. LB3P118 TaxID=3424195 RepID=UPI003F23EBB1
MAVQATYGFAGVGVAAVLAPLLAWGIALRLQPVDIYGYLNRVQSSRRLEREAQRNVELNEAA